MTEGARTRGLPETTLIVTSAAGREGEARRELRRLLGPIDARPLFLKGNLLVHAPGQPTEAILSILREAETATIGRIVPVTIEAAIGREEEHLQTLREAAEAVAAFRPGETFRVACVRRGRHDFSSQDVQRAVGLHLEGVTPGAFRFEDPDYLLPVEVFQDLAYLGCLRRGELLHKTITRMRKYAPGTRPLNRAEAKLREALEAFGVTVDASTRALDLGAAPGGWTKVLAEAGAEILAVDPAQLDPDVAALPRVTHFPARAEELLERPDLGAFDLIVNDMNRDPAESAGLVRSLLPLLTPDGAVIMTVKFMTRRRRQHVRDVTEVLRPHFAELREKHVPHNAKETTVCLQGRLSPG